MSLSDVSDLTDLSSSDEEDVPLSRSKRKAPVKHKTEYKLKNCLRPPRTSQYALSMLYDRIVENSIDLDPEYQREVVWPESKQVGLIDSLLRNYYVPPVIFAVTYGSDGSESRTCIDGKQRLTSIQRFMDGLIPHKDPFNNVKMWYKQAPGSPKRTMLPKPLQATFQIKQLVCIEYDAISGDQERELFQRVQLGMALTPAERMQAINGPLPSLIREIQEEVNSGFEGYMEWGHARGRDFHCVTGIAYQVDNYPDIKSAPSVGSLEKWLQDPNGVRKGFHDDIRSTFRTFLILVREKTFNKPFQVPTRVSPIEFVMIGVLIHAYRTKLSFTQLSSAVDQMRRDVRKKFADIRGNTKVTKHMHEFILKKMKSIELKSDGKGDIPASRDPKYIAPAKAPKRKRAIVTDDEDDEDVVPPSVSRVAKGGGSTKKVSATSSKNGQSVKQVAKSSTSTSTPKPALKLPHLDMKQVGKRSASSSTATPTRSATSKPSSSKVSNSQSPAIPSPMLPPKVPASLSRPRSVASSPRVTPHPPASSNPIRKTSVSVPPPKPPSAAPLPPKTPPPPIPAEPPAGSPPSTTTKQPPVTIKREPQVHTLNSATPASALPDRLAPIRAARLAVAGSASTSQSPTTPTGTSQWLQTNTSVTQDPRRAPITISQPPLSSGPTVQSPAAAQPSQLITTPSFPNGIAISPIELESMLRRVGIISEPQTPLPSPAPEPHAAVNCVTSSNATQPDMSQSGSDMSFSTNGDQGESANGVTRNGFSTQTQPMYMSNTEGSDAARQSLGPNDPNPSGANQQTPPTTSDASSVPHMNGDSRGLSTSQQPDNMPSGPRPSATASSPLAAASTTDWYDDRRRRHSSDVDMDRVDWRDRDRERGRYDPYHRSRPHDSGYRGRESSRGYHQDSYFRNDDRSPSRKRYRGDR